MARKKKDNLSVFDKAFNESGFSNAESSPEVVDMDSIESPFDATTITDMDDDNQQEEAEDDENELVDIHEDNTEIPEDILNNNMSESQEQEEPEQSEEDDVTNIESSWVSDSFDAFAEALGWDVEDDEKPKNVDEFIDYIGQVVEQNSTPQYADQRIAQLDEYVKNGGRFEDFYQNQSQAVSYDNIDIEDESNQKAVVRDYLKLSGYTDEQINRKIERYEDADVLSEEAEDAIGKLKEYTQHQLEVQQYQQEQARQAQEAQMREFVSSLNQSIASLDNIRGIAVPKSDRKALYDYITKVDADGLTQYQKDFNGNLVNNLIESAYFTMKGDSLLGTARRDGQTSAANKLRNMLKHQAKNHSSYNVQEEKQRSVADIASRWL